MLHGSPSGDRLEGPALCRALRLYILYILESRKLSEQSARVFPMAEKRVARDPRRYRVGIDVGTHSVGLAAIEYNEAGVPLEILSAISHIHDSGVLEAKTATTRLAAAGVARRVRRMRRRRVKRLIALDHRLTEWGWTPLPENGDPYLPWRARKRLATERLGDEDELHAHLATALRHMARHRGWRNPYVRVASLYDVALPSTFLAGDPGTDKRDPVAGFKQRVERAVGHAFPDDVTVAELAVAAIDHDNRVPLRMGRSEKSRVEREFSFIGGKLMQSDNANELHAYARMQGLGEARLRELVDLVFAAESPRGSWVGKIGKDPLDNRPRASKATDAFQRFRIVSTLANVRVKEGDSERRLDRAELVRAYEYILNLKTDEQPTWGDIGEVIGKTRRAMSGTASMNAEGDERVPARPPVFVTDQSMRRLKKLGALRDFWVDSDGEHRDALIGLIVDGAKDDSSRAGVAAWEVLDGLTEEELAELDKLDLPAGRAAYSVESLHKLTQHILATGDDLHAARKAVFDVGDDWVPPAEPIGAPVGNPAVDRVLKIIARFLQAAEAEWGEPERITIEHVRNAFMSESTVREIDKDNQRRFKAKLEQRESVGKSVNSEGRVRDSDVRRFETVQRQKSQCLYCGDGITYDNAEMDHIVPRKGPGSTNTRNNLVAVCVDCNRSKSSLPFAVWAERSSKPGVSVEDAVGRTKHWLKDSGLTSKRWAVFLKEVRDRLERTEDDPEIDARSMESVAWMANELRDRIAAHFKGTNSSSGTKSVFVYRGVLTADARRVAGVEGLIPWIGGGGKTRLDRRHHAVDAAVQTLLDESVARTLTERISLRDAERYRRDGVETWKEYDGASTRARERFVEWKQNMGRLTELLVRWFDEDRIVVMENLRLRLGNGRVHEDTIKPMERRRVGEAFSRAEIDAASTPQLWIALTRDPDFDEKDGLPTNPSRRLRVQGTWFDANDEIEFFDKPRAALAVRGGWAALGDSIHHARIYRWEDKGKTKYGMLRVFAADLLKHRGEDLFAVPPHPSWISMRTSHPSIGRVDLSECDYLGWLVSGDELLLKMDSLLTGHVANASEALGMGARQRWRVSGFMSETQVSMVPLLTAAEGLAKFLEIDEKARSHTASLKYVFDRWVTAVDPLFSKGQPVVVRRDALGRPRLDSKARLPSCWQVR